jgi:cell division protein FtsZ
VEAPLGADDLPPPAYRPRSAAQPAAQQAAAPAAPGTATPEALARLRGLVERANEARAAQGLAERPADPRQPAAQAPAPAAAADRPRFGINSIIKSMTGGQAQPEAQPAQPRPRSDSAAPEGEADRSEIPAFLRRQAN